jgi:hypothetical protein
MANKYLELTTGGALAEKEATTASTGVTDAGKVPALDATGRLDITMMPVGVGSEALTVTASETITAPALVNIWNDGGVLKARYADASAASAGKRAVGYVTSTINSGASGTVFFEGRITGLSALTPGAVYFLSGTTPGAPTATAPTTSGHCVQEIGVALSATEITFEPQTPVVRA